MENNTNPIRVFECFSGYGSQSLALKRLSTPFECVGIAEIDKYAQMAYFALHGNVPNFGDVQKIDWSKVPNFDLFTYSFPCQAISSAGLQRGLDEGSGTTSSLLWECKRAIEEKMPKYLLMENVKALTSQKFLPTFRKWQDWLSSMGYNNFTQVLNAKDYGVPQNRERVFMVSILGDEWYSFPKPKKLTRCLADILEFEVDEKYLLSSSATKYVMSRIGKYTQIDGECAMCHTAKGVTNWTGSFVSAEVKQIAQLVEGANYNNPHRGRVYHPFGVSPTLTCMGGGGREPKILSYARDNKGEVTSYHTKDCANTLHTSSGSGGNTDQFVYHANDIRKLTPRECFRLMDVSEDDIDKIQSVGISSTQQYKMAGNSIVVAVLEEIFKQLFYTTKQSTLFG